jgi:hypothetical protein
MEAIGALELKPRAVVSQECRLAEHGKGHRILTPLRGLP